MATRAMIWQSAGGDRYRGLYCHFDGYPAGVGARLRENYPTAEEIEALFAYAVEQGSDLRSLGETPRDSNWSGQGEILFRHRNQLCSESSRMGGCEWAYVFQGGLWETINIEQCLGEMKK